jgi:hypothetical protein
VEAPVPKATFLVDALLALVNAESPIAMLLDPDETPALLPILTLAEALLF